MCAMKVVASLIFRTTMFPHDGKVVTIDQLTYYDPKYKFHIENVLPGSQSITSFSYVCPEINRVVPGYHWEFRMNYPIWWKGRKIWQKKLIAPFVLVVRSYRRVKLECFFFNSDSFDARKGYQGNFIQEEGKTSLWGFCWEQVQRQRVAGETSDWADRRLSKHDQDLDRVTTWSLLIEHARIKWNYKSRSWWANILRMNEVFLLRR